MSQDCLLLNGNGRPVSYFPLSVITWKKAIKLIITRSVFLIKEHEDWVVRSPSIEINVPSILMLQNYHPFHNYVKFSRTNVFLRDLHTCQYCFDSFEKKDLTMDHVVPRSKKGSSTWDNVVTACKVCNLNKGDKEVRPKIEPIKPSFSYLLKGHQINRKGFPDSEWEKYIFQS
ncbi:MAG: HNH endonuclease [Pseudomonadota bacterium]|nr:HNH endonuclease [Pseudomonadota bacterium]|tara:strand:- start:205 stop:723 length:519 start_codon:yes stop_codon:yes gene_type:complete